MELLAQDREGTPGFIVDMLGVLTTVHDLLSIVVLIVLLGLSELIDLYCTSQLDTVLSRDSKARVKWWVGDRGLSFNADKFAVQVGVIL